MGKRSWLAAALALLLLAGCGSPAGAESGPGEASIPSLSRSSEPFPDGETAPAITEPAQTTAPAGTEAPLETGPAPTEPQPGAPTEPSEPKPTQQTPTQPAPTQPAPTEPPAPEPGLPAVLSVGLYDGAFPEDGSGEAVESAAVILVENQSEVQLQFAELHYLIDGREALFRVSELPPGQKAMAVELHRLVATPVSVWELREEESLYVYLASEPEPRISVRSEGDGVLSVTNQGTEAGDLSLCWKQQGEDGVFLGGVAYQLRVPDLAPGETRTLEAPHFTGRSVLVRVSLEP